MIHPQLPAASSAKSAKEPAEPEMVSKIVQVQPKSSHLKMGVHGVEQPAFNLGKDNFLTTGNQQQSKELDCKLIPNFDFLSTLYAPLMAALDQRFLLNKGRRNQYQNIVF